MVLNQMGDQLVRRTTMGGAPVDESTGALLSSNEVDRSIRGMTNQMAALERGLAAQDAALAQLHMQRDARQVSRVKYNRSVQDITESRARIADALALTVAQAERATLNMQAATQLGQTGLEDYLVATSQIADGAQSTRTKITPVKVTKSTRPKLINVNFGSGVLR